LVLACGWLSAVARAAAASQPTKPLRIITSGSSLSFAVCDRSNDDARRAEHSGSAHGGREPDLWQERVLLAGGGEWLVLMPDQEIECMTPREHTSRIMGENRRLPAGVRKRDCYLVYCDDSPNHFYRPVELGAWTRPR
jgi:hypothetical protein